MIYEYLIQFSLFNERYKLESRITVLKLSSWRAALDRQFKDHSQIWAPFTCHAPIFAQITHSA